MSVENLDNYRDQVEKRVAEENEQYPDEKKPGGGGGDEPPLKFVRQCYWANEVGDSLLFNFLNRGRFAYNVTKGQWMHYAGPHWELDETYRALAAIESTVVPQYLRLVEEVEKDIASDPEDTGRVKKLRKKKLAILDRVSKLRGVAGRKNCLICAHSNEDPLIVREIQLDQHPWLLACPNAVIDLRTGEEIPGSPDLWLTKTTSAPWKGLDAKCPRFCEYLLAILDGNQEAYRFLLRCLGYAVTGLNVERIFLVLYGKYGQNGKGTLLEVLYAILGALAGPIQSEMLMSQRGIKNASSPSPDIVALKGRRLVWGSETEEENRFAVGKIKWLTGGDPLTGRGINDKQNTEFMPTHTLLLLTNSKPSAPAHDQAFWERTFIVDFPLSFVAKPDPDKPYQRPRTGALAQTLIEEEASGILALLVRSCMEYQQIGLSPPDCVLEHTRQYQRHENIIADFVEECCEKGPPNNELFKTSSSELYNLFTQWWATQSSYKPMAKKKFGELLHMDFERVKSNGCMYYLGIRKLIRDQYGQPVLYEGSEGGGGEGRQGG